MEQQKLHISALPGYPEEIGRQLWMMEDVRRELLQKLQGTTQEELDAELEGNPSTVVIRTPWLRSARRSRPASSCSCACP